eukprot:7273486-Lingulodinium_polyedra.AAC.1
MGIQVSRYVYDGNLDAIWRKGVVMIAKEEGFWPPTSKVSAEDVRHLQNRVGGVPFCPRRAQCPGRR